MECIQKINLQCDSKIAFCDKHNTDLLPPPPIPFLVPGAGKPVNAVAKGELRLKMQQGCSLADLGQ